MSELVSIINPRYTAALGIVNSVYLRLVNEYTDLSTGENAVPTYATKLDNLIDFFRNIKGDERIYDLGSLPKVIALYEQYFDPRTASALFIRKVLLELVYALGDVQFDALIDDLCNALRISGTYKDAEGFHKGATEDTKGIFIHNPWLVALHLTAMTRVQDPEDNQ